MIFKKQYEFFLKRRNIGFNKDAWTGLQKLQKMHLPQNDKILIEMLPRGEVKLMAEKPCPVYDESKIFDIVLASKRLR